MNAAATCPWCGAILADPRPETCPNCQATLVARGVAAGGSTASDALPDEAAGAPTTGADGDPILPGITVAAGSPTSLIRATDPLLAEAISSSPFRPDEGEEGVQPPTDEVRRLIRQMEMDRLAAQLTADDLIVPPGAITGAAPDATSEGGDAEAPADPTSDPSGGSPTERPSADRGAGPASLD
jgi:hypothetical protein